MYMYIFCNIFVSGSYVEAEASCVLSDVAVFLTYV